MKFSFPALSLIATATLLAACPLAWVQAQTVGAACQDPRIPFDPLPEPEDDEPPVLLTGEVSHGRARAAALQPDGTSFGLLHPNCLALLHEAPLVRQSLDHLQGWQQQQLMRLHQRRLVRRAADQPAQASSVDVHAQADTLSHDRDTDDASARLSAVGLTVGADYRLNERWVVGGSLGLSEPRARWRGLGSRVDGHTVMGGLYASVSTTEQTYLSATATVGTTRYDISTDTDAIGGGSTESSARSRDRGVSLMAGADLPWQSGLTLSPYLRWDLVRSRMRSAEPTFGSLRGGSDRLSMGVQTLWAVPQPWGVLTPYARVELTRITHMDVKGASASGYAGSSGTLPVPHPIKADRSIGQWALGVSGLLPRGKSLFADYERGFGDTGVSQWRFTAGLRSEL